jgi:deazaflavin-dependent oxidoreductase (nitroreductase family)
MPPIRERLLLISATRALSACIGWTSALGSKHRLACCHAALCRSCRPDFHGNDKVCAWRLGCHYVSGSEQLLGRRMARFNRQVLNHLTRPLARHLPGFGVIIHRGRRSGRIYETPVNVFRRSDGYVVALTYGAGADWVRNVLAAGVCELITDGRRMRVVASDIQHDEQLLAVPAVVRPILRMIHVADFLHLSSPEPEQEVPLTQ